MISFPEKLGSRTPSITAVDSPSSRAGNSSCDSGCYAGGEGGVGPKHCHSHGNKATMDRKRGDKSRTGALHNQHHHSSSSSSSSCTSCGKQKQSIANTASSAPTSSIQPPTPSSSYPPTPSAYPQYPPYHQGVPYMTSSSHYNTLGTYPWTDSVDPHDSSHSSPAMSYPPTAMSTSRTLTEMNAVSSGNSGTSGYPDGGQPSMSVSMSVASPRPGAAYPGIYRDLPPSTLTEEDQEVIAITYGTHRRRKLSTPIQAVSASSSHSEISGMGMGASMSSVVNAGNYAPSSYYSSYRPYDGVSVCSDPSCAQCVAYLSCPQCASNYHHYVNTAIRSDSKSSKMSYSSTNTQTTCLSPDQEEHYGGSYHGNYPTSPTRLLSYPPTPHSHGYHQHGGVPMYPLSPSYGHPAPGTPNKFLSTFTAPESSASPFPTSSHHHGRQTAPPGDLYHKDMQHGNKDKEPIKRAESANQMLKTPVGDDDGQKSIGTISGMSSSSSKTKLQQDSKDATENVSKQLLQSQQSMPPASVWSQHYPSDNARTESPSMASLYSRDSDGRRGSAGSKREAMFSSSSAMKSPMRSLMPLVSTKLNAERIDLGQSPYSSQVSGLFSCSCI